MPRLQKNGILCVPRAHAAKNPPEIGSSLAAFAEKRHSVLSVRTRGHGFGPLADTMFFFVGSNPLTFRILTSSPVHVHGAFSHVGYSAGILTAARHQLFFYRQAGDFPGFRIDGEKGLAVTVFGLEIDLAVGAGPVVGLDALGNPVCNGG